MRKQVCTLAEMFLITVLTLIITVSFQPYNSTLAYITDLSNSCINTFEHSEISQPSEISQISEISQSSEISQPSEISQASEISQPSEISQSSEISQASEISQPSEISQLSEPSINLEYSMPSYQPMEESPQKNPDTPTTGEQSTVILFAGIAILSSLITVITIRKSKNRR